MTFTVISPAHPCYNIDAGAAFISHNKIISLSVCEDIATALLENR